MDMHRGVRMKEYVISIMKKPIINTRNNKINSENNKKHLIRKKHICMLCMFALMLADPVLLCGCASTHDDITMDFSKSSLSDAEVFGTECEPETDFAVMADDGENMTEVSVHEAETQMVYIYVCGAVELPGVYCLRQGSRLYEAVEMAGGLAGNADDTCLNMARTIADGEQVVILAQEEAALLRESGTYFPESPGQEVSAGDSGLVNINTATIAELTSVSGIGESRAKAIIEYREKNGSFRSIEEIKKVEGIKDGLFSKIKDKIKI